VVLGAVNEAGLNRLNNCELNGYTAAHTNHPTSSENLNVALQRTHEAVAGVLILDFGGLKSDRRASVTRLASTSVNSSEKIGRFESWETEVVNGVERGDAARWGMA
jgi:hypothetical protein